MAQTGWTPNTVRLFAAPAIALTKWRRKKLQHLLLDVPGQWAEHRIAYKAEEDPLLKRFSLRELQVATNKFSKRKILHFDGYRTVYKGRLVDGSLVAVKRLEVFSIQDRELWFQTEVIMVRMAVHRNLLSLCGFCRAPTERLLVYPYMANGTVSSCLRERNETQPPLDWRIRKRITLGSARGLVHLHDHCNAKIIHYLVKTTTIWLDEEFEVVVGGFSLARPMDCNDTHVTTLLRPFGLIAPEYLATGKCSEKTDVFQYGVMLLELITGLAHYDDITFLDWVNGLLQKKKLETLVDAELQSNYSEDEVEQLIQVAILCLQDAAVKHPKMSEVVRMLEGDGLAERWKEWQKEEIFRQECPPPK